MSDLTSLFCQEAEVCWKYVLFAGRGLCFKASPQKNL